MWEFHIFSLIYTYIYIYIERERENIYGAPRVRVDFFWSPGTKFFDHLMEVPGFISTGRRGGVVQARAMHAKCSKAVEGWTAEDLGEACRLQLKGVVFPICLTFFLCQIM